MYDCVLQVPRMLLSDIFNPKIVNYESELDWPPVMLPKAWDQFARAVAERIQLF